MNIAEILHVINQSINHMLLGVYCFYFPELAEVIYKFSYFSSY